MILRVDGSNRRCDVIFDDATFLRPSPLSLQIVARFVDSRIIPTNLFRGRKKKRKTFQPRIVAIDGKNDDDVSNLPGKIDADDGHGYP